MIFREQASHGEWCALLVPLALLVSHSHDVENYDQFRAVVIILALAMSVFSFIFGKFGMFSYSLDPGGAVNIVYGNIVNGNIVFILTSWWGHRKR